MVVSRAIPVTRAPASGYRNRVYQQDVAAMMKEDYYLIALAIAVLFIAGILVWRDDGKTVLPVGSFATDR